MDLKEINMQTALNILSDEHQNILKAIDGLLKECDSLQAGSTIDKNFFSKVINFIRGYADKFHHAKEEDILFKEFNKCAEDGRAHCNPLEQMLYEHNLGRHFIKELEKGIENDNKDIIIANAKGYAQLLQEHIFKEDNVLYPMIDEALSNNVKDAILAKFDQIERELNDKKDQYLLFLEEL